MKYISKSTFLRQILIIFVICCFLLFLIVLGLLNALGYEYYCNSDVQADAQVAKMMWDQKTIFPEGWRFGNQLYVVATPVLAALLYGILGHINIAMIIATEIMTLLIFLSLFWLFRTFSKDLLLYFTTCIVLICTITVLYGPYGLHGMLFFSQASFYSCYLITMFFICGDYIRSINSTKPRKFHWLISLLLCFATGIQSSRQTVLTVLPILCCELLFAFRRFCKKQALWDKSTCLSLIRSLSYLFANIGGLFTIKYMNIPQSSIYGKMQLTSFSQLKEKMDDAFTALLEISRLDYYLWGKPDAIFDTWILFSVISVCLAALIWLFRIKHQESHLALSWLLCVIGIIGTLLSTVVFDVVLRPIYAFLWFPLVAFSVLMILRELPAILQNCGIFIICILALFTFSRSCSSTVSELTSPPAQSPEFQVSQWAINNDYKYIYGDYYQGVPQIAAYSDGALIAGCWFTEANTFTVLENNTPQNIYGTEQNKKALYIFTSVNEQHGLLAAQEAGVTMTQVAEFGDYRAYTSPVPLMKTQVTLYDN